MADTQPPAPAISNEVAEQAVKRTKDVLSAMVNRIYGTQRMMGVWVGDEGEPESEDFPDFLLHLHGKLASCFEAHVAGGIIADTEGQPVEIPDILVDMAIDLLGAARCFKPNIGEKMVDTIIEHARQAEQMQQEELQMLGDFSNEAPPEKPSTE